MRPEFPDSFLRPSIPMDSPGLALCNQPTEISDVGPKGDHVGNIGGLLGVDGNRWPRDELLDFPSIVLSGRDKQSYNAYIGAKMMFKRMFGFEHGSEEHINAECDRLSVWHAEADRREAERKRSKAVSREEDKENTPGRWYFITYTRPPTFANPKDVLNSAKRCIRSKAVSATMWAYSLELQKNGTPHVHIRLFSNKYPDYTKCLAAFNDGHTNSKEAIQSEKFNTAKYVIKAESKPTPEWLEKYDLDKYFWCSDDYSGPRPPEYDIASPPSEIKCLELV